ncbi:phosphotransferase family protein [Streptosporangium lutulentum]|uniref:Aminoglycoside phosphotransferase (APT) family kinase protein n=1 Tax=Streptosporangium lutulentum TaxID=1461250 RepID=A0ABT9Q577_9ACTN|nr:phosphotransferase [Streptosporangium lutulentum]MDP9841837.1 aminoglycoside phosphotransferase (APT) family kinase protein [Streptosporangium lutulentum]
MSDSDDLLHELRRIAVQYGEAPATVLPTRPDVIIVRAGPVVVKAHAPGAELEPLVERMRATAHPALRGIMLEPVTEEVMIVADRLVTVWPTGVPVNPMNPEAAPWEAAARLLARLHAVPAGGLLPLRAAGGPAKVTAMVARLDGDSAAELVVRRALTCLPDLDAEPAGESFSESFSLAHGDWHMGQMVRTPDEWILIDNDDLGVGDPAWDLARPAAWFAAGLLEPEVWHRFLGAYRAAGGRAVPPDGDPWDRLNLPAQATTVQLTAGLVATARREGRPMGEAEQTMIDACLRIIRLRSACHSVPTQ